MRILGVDYGSVRTGLALSDPLGLICAPYEIVEERDEAALIDRILECAAAEGVTEIVVGLPRPLSGGTNAQLQRAEAFRDALAARAPMNVRGWDERFTSKMAARTRASRSGEGTGRRARMRAGKNSDDVAACHLLQGYLDAHTPSGASQR